MPLPITLSAHFLPKTAMAECHISRCQGLGDLIAEKLVLVSAKERLQAIWPKHHGHPYLTNDMIINDKSDKECSVFDDVHSALPLFSSSTPNSFQSLGQPLTVTTTSNSTLRHYNTARILAVG